MYQGLWVSELDCTILIKGERIIDRTWVGRGIVSKEVGSQGKCSACWAWVVAEATQAALKIAGTDVPPLSAQEIINDTYKGRRGCRGGQVLTALQWIVEKGIGTEHNCPYKGTKSLRPAPLSKERYFIDGWKVIDDVESKMVEALEEQPLIVAIPYVSGVANYETGLLDLNRACEKHDPTQMPKKHHPDDEHTVLLVERGHIKPDDYPDIQINFWVIKNQWDSTWGEDGFGDIIFASSLVTLKQKLGLDVNDSDWFYTPLAPVVKNSKDELIYVDKVRTDLNPKKLKEYVKEKLDTVFIILLYHSTSLIEEHPKLLEEFRLISASYEHHTNVVLARIDHIQHPNAAKILEVPKSRQPVLVTFRCKQEGSTRSLKDALVFPKKYELTFAKMLHWLEKATGNALEQELGALEDLEQALGEVTLESEEH